MRITTILFFLIFLLGNVVNLCAQKIVTGTIKDKNGQPIGKAKVLLHTQSDSTKILIGYTFSDTGGYYRLSFENLGNSFLLSVNFDGFQKEEKVVFFTKDQEEKKENFLLNTSASFLDTVKINVKFKISKTGDTLTFNPDAFSLKNETNIEQLLTRLPGMEVAENGQITFNGAPVNSVLIDGDDLFKKNYQQLTQAASPKIVDKIELIKNYQKDSLLKEFKKSGSQVINLSLKEQYKNYLFGNGSIGYGNNDNKLADIFLIKLSPKTKLQAGVNYNSIGNTFAADNIFNPSDILSEKKFFEFDPVSSLLNVNSYIFPNIPMYYQRLNESFQANANALFKNGKWETVINAKYASDLLHQKQQSRNLYLDGSDLFSTNDGSLKISRQEYNISSSKSGKKESIYFSTALTNRNRDIHLHTFSNHSLETHQQLNDKDLNWQANFHYIRKLKEGILWTTTLGYFDQRIPGNLQTSPDFLFWLIPVDVSMNQLNSSATNRLKFGKLKSALSFEKGKWNNELAFLLTSENNMISSALEAKELHSDSLKLPFRNHIDFHNHFITFQYSGNYYFSKKNRITFKIINEPHDLQYISDSGTIGKSKFLYDYSLGFLSTVRNSSYFLNVGWTKRLSDNIVFYPNYVQNSFHNLEKGIPDLYHQNSLYFQGIHNVTSLSLGLISRTFLNYSYNHGYYITNINIVGLGTVRSRLFYPHSTQRLMFILNANKTLGNLPFHLNTNLNYFRNSFYSAFNDQISKAEIQSLNASVGLRTHFKSVFNLDYTFSVLHSKNKIISPKEKITSVNTILNKANIFLTSNKLFNTTLTVNHVANKSISFQKLFLDLMLNREFLHQKLLLEINARNVFNVREIETLTIVPAYSQENNIEIRGAEMMIKIKYNFR